MRTPEQIIGKDALMQLLFEGYAVVPVTPTEAMIDAGSADHAHPYTPDLNNDDAAKSIYAAMLAALNPPQAANPLNNKTNPL